MEAIFGDRKLAELNERADAAKREQTGNVVVGIPTCSSFGPVLLPIDCSWR
jgi:hypothetical protein